MPLARARGGASQEGLVSLLGRGAHETVFRCCCCNGAGVAGRNEGATELVFNDF